MRSKSSTRHDEISGPEIPPVLPNYHYDLPNPYPLDAEPLTRQLGPTSGQEEFLTVPLLAVVTDYLLNGA